MYLWLRFYSFNLSLTLRPISVSVYTPLKIYFSLPSLLPYHIQDTLVFISSFFFFSFADLFPRLSQLLLFSAFSHHTSVFPSSTPIYVLINCNRGSMCSCVFLTIFRTSVNAKWFFYNLSSSRNITSF